MAIRQPAMTTIWLTYAWLDDVTDDVTFIAQELEHAGLTVRRDKWDLRAGARLWQQIDSAITDPAKSDAWLIYATEHSLTSEACQEELAYALDRALKIRGATFPILALFPSHVDDSLIPGAIRTRLYVSTEDGDWVERIVAGAKGEAPSMARKKVDPFGYTVHDAPPNPNGERQVIEMWPRAGTWSPFFCAVPIGEKDRVQPRLTHGPRRIVPQVFSIVAYPDQVSQDGEWWILAADNIASPTQSYFLHCAEMPSEIRFGIANSGKYHFIRRATRPPEPFPQED